MWTKQSLFKEILILSFVSSILGITAQAILPNGIGLKTELTLLNSDSGEVAVPSVTINPNGDIDIASNIALNDAYAVYQRGEVLFFDARSQEDYAAGHIRGAVNLPVHAFIDSLSFLEGLDSDLLLITYCDGADCNASIDLAADLKMMGFSRVVFFFGGWQEWQAAGYPTESKPEK